MKALIPSCQRVGIGGCDLNGKCGYSVSHGTRVYVENWTNKF